MYVLKIYTLFGNNIVLGACIPNKSVWVPVPALLPILACLLMQTLTGTRGWPNYVAHPDGILCYCLQPDPALGATDTWGVSQQRENASPLPLYTSTSCSAFQNRSFTCELKLAIKQFESTLNTCQGWYWFFSILMQISLKFLSFVLKKALIYGIVKRYNCKNNQCPRSSTHRSFCVCVLVKCNAIKSV